MPVWSNMSDGGRDADAFERCAVTKCLLINKLQSFRQFNTLQLIAIVECKISNNFYGWRDADALERCEVTKHLTINNLQPLPKFHTPQSGHIVVYIGKIKLSAPMSMSMLSPCWFVDVVRLALSIDEVVFFLVGSYVVTFCGNQLDEEDSPLLKVVLVLTCRCTIHLLDSTV